MQKTGHKSRIQSELAYFSDHSSSKIRERTLSSKLLEESQNFKHNLGSADMNWSGYYQTEMLIERGKYCSHV